MSTVEWTNKLKDDLKRINRTIKIERTKIDDWIVLVNEGIKNLRLLQEERDRLLDDCLGEEDE